MTTLITGATGLIGRALTNALLEGGERVRILTRRPHRVVAQFDKRVGAFEWHPRTEPLPAGALDGVKRIVHLLGEPFFGPLNHARREQFVASRRIATQRLIAALGPRPAHLVVASNVAVYGFAPGEAVSEDSVVEPPADKFALAVRACEETAEAARGNGSVVTLVRLGLVIAPDTFPDMLLRLLETGIAWREESPEAAIPAIDHADAVSLIASLAQMPPFEGVIHAVAPEPLRTVELEKVLLEACARRGHVALPHWFLRRHIGVLADMLHSRRRILPRRAVDGGFVFQRPDPLASVRATLPPPGARQPARRRSIWHAVLQRT